MVLARFQRCKENGFSGYRMVSVGVWQLQPAAENPAELQQRVPEVAEASGDEGRGGGRFLSVLEQGKDINYPSISYRYSRSEVDLASQMSFTFFFFVRLAVLFLNRPAREASRSE